MVQRSGIDTIKYHTWPRIPMGKWQTHRRHHKREPRGQSDKPPTAILQNVVPASDVNQIWHNWHCVDDTGFTSSWISFLYTAFGPSDFVCFYHLSRELGLVLTNRLAVFLHSRGLAKFHNFQYIVLWMDRVPFQAHWKHISQTLLTPHLRWRYKKYFFLFWIFSFVRLQFLGWSIGDHPTPVLCLYSFSFELV